MTIPAECRLLLAVASLLVPRERRHDWQREWSAEIWHWWASCPQDLDARLVLLKHSTGAWHDAWFFQNEFRPRWIARPRFALVCLLCLIGIVAAASSGLRTIRRLMRELPYSQPAKLATLSQPGFFSGHRIGVPVGKLPVWREKAGQIAGIEGYRWSTIEVKCGSRRMKVSRAQVTPGFFHLLGERPSITAHGKAVVRQSLWRQCGGDLTIGGRKYEIAGTVPDRFWFLDESIALWTLLPEEYLNSTRLSGAVVRLQPGATAESAQQELRAIATRSGNRPSGRDVDVALVAPRVRQTLRFWAGVWLSLVLVAIAWVLIRGRNRAGLFFLAKFVLLITASTLVVLEFTGAASISMYGGTDFGSEPVAIWLFLLACCGSLWFSIADQRMRCRVCLTRLQAPVHMGSRGSLLFDISGTELVCEHGHGTLYVDEMTESLHESDRWTRLDESWREIFQGSR